MPKQPRRKKKAPFKAKEIYPTMLYKDGEQKIFTDAFELQEAEKDGWKDSPK